MLSANLQDDVILGDGGQDHAGGDLAAFAQLPPVEHHGPFGRVGGVVVGAIGQGGYLLFQGRSQGAERYGLDLGLGSTRTKGGVTTSFTSICCSMGLR